MSRDKGSSAVGRSCAPKRPISILHDVTVYISYSREQKFELHMLQTYKQNKQTYKQNISEYVKFCK